MMAATGPREVRRWLSGTATWLHRVDREGQRAYCALRPWSREECGAHLRHVATSTSRTRGNGTGGRPDEQGMAQGSHAKSPMGTKGGGSASAARAWGCGTGSVGKRPWGLKGLGESNSERSLGPFTQRRSECQTLITGVPTIAMRGTARQPWTSERAAPCGRQRGKHKPKPWGRSWSWRWGRA